MILTRTTLLSASAFLVLATGAMGCNNGADSQRSFLAAGTSAPIGSQGLLSSGVTEYNNLGDLQNAASKLPAGSEFIGPNLQILSPKRGETLPAGPVVVEILAQDTGKGLASVFIAGQGVTPDADGKARLSVDLRAGLQTLVAEAVDAQGNRTERHVSVLAGTLVAEGTEVRQGAGVRVTDDALDALEPQIGTKVEDQRQTIVRQVLSASPPKNTKYTRFSFGAAAGTLDCVPQGVRFQLKVDTVALDLEYKAKILFVFSTTKRGTVRAQELVIDALATPSLDAQGNLTSTISQVQARTNGFSVPDWAKGEEGTIRRSFEQAFATQAGAAIDQALTDALTKTKTSGSATFQVSNKPIDATWRLDQLAIDNEGINLTFSGQVSAPAATATYGTPGVLALGTPNAVLGGSGGAAWNGALALHQDLINQTLHSAWRQGALSFTFNQAKIDQIDPNGSHRLDTDTLIASAPLLAKVLPAGEPLDLDVECKLPPVVQVVSNAPEHFVLKFGAVRVDYRVIDPATGTFANLAETYYALEIGVVLKEEQGRIKFVPTGATVLRVDVVGKPLPQAEVIVDDVSRSMAPAFVKGIVASLPGMALPALKGFELKGLDFSTSGDSILITGQASPQATTARVP